MDLRTDRRGQAVQVGAVLLLGVAIVMFATYQATIIPNENAQAEFQHNQNVHSQMGDVRNAIVSPPEKGHSESVKVDLGTSYASRAIGTNPGDPSGTLRTNGTTADNVDIGFRNAKPITGTPSYWAGNMDFNSGALLYEPNYNEHKAPKTVYEHTALYNDDFRSGRATLKEPSLIDGNDINIVALTGELLKSGSGTASFDVTTVDKSTETLQLTDAKSGNLALTFHSRQPASYWERLEDDETDQYIQDIASSEANGGWNEVTIELTPNERYDVTLTNVSVDKNPPDPTEDGTKMSMLVAEHAASPVGFEGWSNTAGPTDDCNPTDVGNRELAFETDMIGGVCRLAGGGNVGGVEGYSQTADSYVLETGEYEIGFTVYGFMDWDNDAVAKWQINGVDEWTHTFDASNTPKRMTIEVSLTNTAYGSSVFRFISENMDSADEEAWGIQDFWIRHADNEGGA